MSGSLAQYQSLIDNAASTYGVPQSVLSSVIGAESGGNPGAYNPSSGASGIAQFIPSTAAEYGVNTSSPSSSISGAAAYLANLFQSTGSWSGAVTSYGTVPSTGPVTPGQTTVWNAAQQADGNGPPPSLLNQLTGGYMTNPAFGSAAAAGAAANAAGYGAAGSWMSGSALRIAMAVLAFLLIAIGLVSLITKQSPGTTIVSPVESLARITG